MCEEIEDMVIFDCVILVGLECLDVLFSFKEGDLMIDVVCILYVGWLVCVEILNLIWWVMMSDGIIVMYFGDVDLDDDYYVFYDVYWMVIWIDMVYLLYWFFGMGDGL